MSLRTTALVAGVIGVLLLVTGLVADAQRPPREVTPDAAVNTAVVVYEPAMLAFAGDNRIGVSGDGPILGLTARPADAEAWLADHTVTYVTEMLDWETLATTSAEPVAPSPSASPSASPSDEPSPSPSASDGADEEEAEPVDIVAETSQDHWRDEFRGTDRLSIKASDVVPGEVLVIVSTEDTPLTATDLTQTRDVQDGWITPLIWWGAFLTLVGVVALVLRFIDFRPAQAKGEEWINKRQRVSDGDEPAPGSRRARREAGEHLPEASLDEEAVVSARSVDSASPASAPSAERGDGSQPGWPDTTVPGLNEMGLDEPGDGDRGEERP